MNSVIMILSSFILTISAYAFTGDGMPLKYISSCEIDLNKDGQSDVVLLVETLSGRETIALHRKKDGFDSYIVTTGKPNMHLACKFGNEIQERGKPKKIKTNGTYIELIKPESSSAAYYWDGRKYVEIWTAD